MPSCQWEMWGCTFNDVLGLKPRGSVVVSVVQVFNFLFYFLLGVSSALDTLGSQAYGAKDEAALHCWSVAAIAALSVLCIPMAAVLYFGEFVTAAIFQQPPSIAAVCLWSFFECHRATVSPPPPPPGALKPCTCMHTHVCM